ncbi:MAG TPA: hypothetical protein VK600_00385 [Candidatus Saccharimonadales bacterium]|nr:hypothetical protein [Candidatus Saccharimonadales bacterium]
MALIEAVQGERRAASNVQTDARAGRYSELIVNDVGLGRYFEAALNKRIFGLGAAGFTLVAANAGALAAALQPIVGIVNPIGNSRAAVIIRARHQSRSGTPAGPLYAVGGITSGAITTAAAGSILDLSLQGASSSMKAYNNVALTGYVAAGGGSFQLPAGGPAAIAAGAGVYHADFEEAGMFIVPPGGIFGLSATGAGTTHIVDAGLVWVEIDWPL